MQFETYMPMYLWGTGNWLDLEVITDEEVYKDNPKITSLCNCVAGE